MGRRNGYTLAGCGGCSSTALLISVSHCAIKVAHRLGQRGPLIDADDAGSGGAGRMVQQRIQDRNVGALLRHNGYQRAPEIV